MLNFVSNKARHSKCTPWNYYFFLQQKKKWEFMWISWKFFILYEIFLWHFCNFLREYSHLVLIWPETLNLFSFIAWDDVLHLKMKNGVIEDCEFTALMIYCGFTCELVYRALMIKSSVSPIILLTFFHRVLFGIIMHNLRILHTTFYLNQFLQINSFHPKSHFCRFFCQIYTFNQYNRSSSCSWATRWNKFIAAIVLG